MAASDTLGLLARYGRDIAGALVVGADEPAPRAHAVQPYDEEGLIAEVAELDVNPLGVHDDSELSIAGLQNKMLLVRLPDGSWGRPLHGHPSTHILKVDSAARPGVVEAEAQCLALASAVELTTIEHELVRVGEQRCLIVSRFDRREEGDEIRRIHQEDLCQATGRLDKYESRGRGGPGFADAARLVDRYARDPEEQLRRLLAVATFTLAIGNADAHGKNVSLLHDVRSNVVIAPLYDTVPTIMWPSLRTEAAMGIDGRHSLVECDREDLVREAVRWPLARTTAEAVVDDTLRRLRAALADGVIPPRSRLARTIRARVDNLFAGGVAGAAKAPFGERR